MKTLKKNFKIDSFNVQHPKTIYLYGHNLSGAIPQDQFDFVYIAGLQIL